jgi:hypothetical protein
MLKLKFNRCAKYFIPLSFALSMGAEAATTSADITRFVGDTNYTTNIFDLTTKSGLTGAPKNQPWSGSYWPLHEGSIANPYDQNSRAWLNFVTRLVFVSVDTAEKNFQSRMSKIRTDIDHLSAKTIDRMAPSEKYDLYLGDRDFSLTTSIWQSLGEEFKAAGTVADWEGSCQGWTAAASFSPRPSKAIQILSLDGKYLIPFYPDDLKALDTLLWANSLIQDHTTLQGMRCSNAKPTFDKSTGRITDINCVGVDPGNFHISVLEMIGVRKTPFIVDRSNNTEVWNQPVAGYELKYFNPTTGDDAPLAKAVVTRASYQDPYANFRNANAVSIVGVKLSLKYSSETIPSHQKRDDKSHDKIKSLELTYDLELDADSNVVGGEWRDSVDNSPTDASTAQDSGDSATIPKFPSFIWNFQDKNPVAMSIADIDLAAGDVTTLDHASLITASKKAAAFRYNDYRYDASGNAVLARAELKPQPLQRVVKYLVDQSNK